MKKGELPREYHFFQGHDYVRVPERVLIANRRIKVKDLTIQEALGLMHRRALQYVRPFNIECVRILSVDRPSRTLEKVIEVRLAARTQWPETIPPFRLHRLDRAGFGDAMLGFKTKAELFKAFEHHLARWSVGEDAAL